MVGDFQSLGRKAVSQIAKAAIDQDDGQRESLEPGEPLAAKAMGFIVF